MEKKERIEEEEVEAGRERERKKSMTCRLKENKERKNERKGEVTKEV